VQPWLNLLKALGCVSGLGPPTTLTFPLTLWGVSQEVGGAVSVAKSH
jgi:hypothetical protein